MNVKLLLAIINIGVVVAAIANNTSSKKWYPPVLGLDSMSNCRLDCLMMGLKDWNTLKACLDQSQIDPNTIVWREDVAYDEARQTNDGFLTQFPALVVYAHNKNDVSDAVRCATEGGYQASASGGRHYTLGIVDGYVTIDTSNLTEKVVIDKAASTLTIPAGLTNGMVLHYLSTLAPKNAALSIGNGGSVGYTGYTLAGGLGYATPMVGMSCDALVEIEMVLFNGDIVRSNKTHNSELLWASCGGGPGLGIVTEIKVRYRLLDTEFFSYGRVHFSRQPTLSEEASMVSKILDYFSSPNNVFWGGEAFIHPTDNFSLYGMFSKSLDGVKDMMKDLELDEYVESYALDTTPSFAEASASFVCDLILRISLGTEALNSEVLEPVSLIVGRNASVLSDEAGKSRFCNQSDILNAILLLSEDRSSPINWSINPVWGPAGNTSNLSVPRWHGKYRFTPNLSPQDMEKLLRIIPSTVRIVRFNSGVVSEISEDGTAFPWRESPILMRVREEEEWYGEGSLTSAMMEILQSASPGKIGSYLGLPDHATRDWQGAFYGMNYIRLARARAKYDPLNTFGKFLTPGQLFDSVYEDKAKAGTETSSSISSTSLGYSYFLSCLYLVVMVWTS